MLTQKRLTIHLTLLPLTVSDLLVPLETRDGPEVIFQARILKKMADGCEVPLLGMTAHKIEQAAVADDLDAARSLIPELDQHLRQALLIIARAKDQWAREGPMSLNSLTLDP